MPFDPTFRQQVQLLVSVLPLVAKEGGTLCGAPDRDHGQHAEHRQPPVETPY